MTETQQDEALLEAWIGGDEASFDVIYQKYRRDVRRVIASVIPRVLVPQDLDDIEQATWMHIVQYRKSALRSAMPLKSILARTAWFVAQRYYVGKSRYRKAAWKNVVNLTDYGWQKVANRYRGRDEEAMRASDAIEDFLFRLALVTDQRTYEVMKARYVEGATTQEIGERFGLTSERISQICKEGVAAFACEYDVILLKQYAQGVRRPRKTA